MNTINVKLDNKPCYDINITEDFSGINELFDFGTRKIGIITDDNVANNCLDEFKSALPKDNEIFVYSMTPGENQKNLDTVKEIYKFLIGNGFGRSDILIALGGGVVGDITGFTAATFKRGMDFIQVPTTLLSMVDSSIGGKTGVDFDGYKNMVGAFKMPALVYINYHALKSLPDRQYYSGFAEIMKAALIKDSTFYTYLIDNIYEICDREDEAVSYIIEKAINIKKLVVELDPYEKRERMMLNFGHTIGHAIEKYKNFELTHGECIALGMVAASYISYQKNFLTKEEYYEIRDMFVPFCLPISIEMMDYDAVIENLKNDKKVIDGKMNFILIKRIGKAMIDTSVSFDDIKKALEELNFDEAW